MEKLIRDIESYAAAVGQSPQSILRRSVGATWRTWSGWRAGRSSPTMALADRVYAYMRDNPPDTAAQSDAA